jgi:hypothetical protein
MRTILLAATLTFALQAGAQTTAAPAPAKHPTAKKISATKRHAIAPAAKVADVHHPSAPVAPAVIPTPYAQNPIQQLRGTARAILIFAPDTSNPDVLMQFALLERNEMALSERDAILVPIIAQHHTSDEAFPGENISAGTDGDQLSARLKFNVKPTDFTIILLDKDGTEKLRSNTPVSVASIGARIDGVPGPGE